MRWKDFILSIYISFSNPRIFRIYSRKINRNTPRETHLTCSNESMPRYLWITCSVIFLVPTPLCARICFPGHLHVMWDIKNIWYANNKCIQYGGNFAIRTPNEMESNVATSALTRFINKYVKWMNVLILSRAFPIASMIQNMEFQKAS